MYAKNVSNKASLMLKLAKASAKLNSLIEWELFYVFYIRSHALMLGMISCIP